MNFLVGLPRCNPPPVYFAETLAAIAASSYKPQALLIVDNGDTALTPVPSVDGVSVELVRPGRNIGCAGAWNVICEWAVKQNLPVIILNDDCAVAPDTFKKLISQPGAALVCARGFSCFRMKPEIYRHVGRFDEDFYPAYFEDADYRRRLQLANVAVEEWSVEEIEIIAPGRTRTPSGIVHGKHASDGSYQGWTGDKLKWFWSRYEANRLRYIAKWGGEFGKETFATPYGKPA